MIGSTVDQYEILERIAGGGMGEVYLARDQELDRLVAIKCVRPELSDLAQVTKRFRTEARTLAALSHLNIATVYRFFEDQERLFLVMEYIDGCPFGQLLVNEGIIPPERAVVLVGEALSGLGYAHQNAVVHRDIKPGNLMLDHQSNVKVLDFGIAHLMGATRMTRVGSIVGTPAYMAPEQVLGKPVDPRTDLYSIGVVLFEMLSGKTPYSANSDFEIMRAHVESVPPSLKDLTKNNVPARLQQSVERALQKDIDKRFQSAEEFADALQSVASLERTAVLSTPMAQTATQLNPALALAATEPMSAGPQSSTQPPQSQAKSNRWPLAAAVVALSGLAGIFLLTAEKPKTVNATVVDSSAPTANDNYQAALIESQQGQANLQTARPTSQSAAGTGSGEVNTPATLRSSDPAPQNSAALTSSVAPAGSAAPTAFNSISDTTAPAPRSTLPIERRDYRIRTVKFGAHEVQKTGRVSRAVAYNAAFALSVPNGAEQPIEVEEYVRVYRGGALVREQSIRTENRSAGQFKTKNRIPNLKTLEPGMYDVELSLRHQGRTLGQAKWKLLVRD